MTYATSGGSFSARGVDPEPGKHVTQNIWFRILRVRRALRKGTGYG
jgi:hypothetical protein